MTESAESAYDRGHEAGGIEARLGGHDRHFAAINGQLGDIDGRLTDMANLIGGLEKAVQRLADQAVARDATVITTAAALKDTVNTTANALKDAEAARRDKSEQSWSPVAKLLAVLGSVVAVVAVSVSLYIATHR